LNDLNVFNNPSLLDTGKGFPIAVLILALLTTNEDVNLCKRSVLSGK
jgi:hypothetical protein